MAGRVIRRKSPDLEKFLKAKRDGRLLGSVDRHLRARPPEYRPWKHLHPSAISKGYWCPRAAWYVVTSDTAPPPEKVGRVSQSIFDEGHLIHDKWQRFFWEMGNLYGVWQCQFCHHRWWAQSPATCVECFSSLIKYAEVPLSNPEWLISGHADGWIKGIGDDCVIEIKSVGTGTVRIEAPNMWSDYGEDLAAVWKDLKRPFSSHLRQAQLYLRVLNATRSDAPKEVVFIYECKLNQQAKEFPVAYQESTTDPIIEQVLVVKGAVERGEPPACPKSGCSECRPYDKEKK